MLAGARRWFGELTSLRKFFCEVARNLGERPKLPRRQGFENDFRAVFLDQNFRAVKPEGLRQAHRLAPSVLEDLGRNHIYTLYLLSVAFKPEDPHAVRHAPGDLRPGFSQEISVLGDGGVAQRRTGGYRVMETSCGWLIPPRASGWRTGSPSLRVDFQDGPEPVNSTQLSRVRFARSPPSVVHRAWQNRATLGAAESTTVHDRSSVAVAGARSNHGPRT